METAASSAGGRSAVPALLSAGLELGKGTCVRGECFKEENVDFMPLCSFPVLIKLLSPIVCVKPDL